MSLYQTRDGAVWAGTLNGIAQLKNGKVTSYKIGNTDASNTVTAIAEDQRGSLWIGTQGGLKEFRNGRVIKTYRSSQKLPNEMISALYADRLGNLWLGLGDSHLAYLARFNDGKFTFITEKDGLPSSHVHSITEPPRA